MNGSDAILLMLFAAAALAGTVRAEQIAGLFQ